MLAGVDPRVATGYSLKVCLVVAPVGFLGFGAFGLVASSLRWNHWFFAAVAGGLGAVANGLFYGGLVEAIRWSRTHARWLFLSLLVGLIAYGAILVALVVTYWR
jgi:hypothetical protein